MDKDMLTAGIAYEALLLRAYHTGDIPEDAGADRRHFYLLYFIRQGIDLRETGYWPQFNTVKDNTTRALCRFLGYELHPEEETVLKKLLTSIETVHAETALSKIISKALQVTERLNSIH